MRLALPLILLLFVVGHGRAAVSLGLGDYVFQGSYALPSSVPEASAVTYNWDRDSLVVVDDGGLNLVEVSRSGQLLHAVTLTGHPVQGNLNTRDTEAVTYLGGGRYAIGLERNRNVIIFSTAFPAGGETIDLGTGGQRIALFGPGDDVGNSGLEGLSFDPLTGGFLAVKEKSPEEFYRVTYNPVTLIPTVTQPFSKSQIKAWGLDDLADVQSLGAVPAFAGTALADNFLLLSQESSRLLEIDGTGAVLGSLDLGGLAAGWNVEGVTIDFSGAIYVVGESTEKGTPARLFVFTPAPIPEPTTATLLLVTLGAGAAWRLRRSGTR